MFGRVAHWKLCLALAQEAQILKCTWCPWKENSFYNFYLTKWLSSPGSHRLSVPPAWYTLGVTFIELLSKGYGIDYGEDVQQCWQVFFSLVWRFLGSVYTQPIAPQWGWNVCCLIAMTMSLPLPVKRRVSNNPHAIWRPCFCSFPAVHHLNTHLQAIQWGALVTPIIITTTWMTAYAAGFQGVFSHHSI